MSFRDVFEPILEVSEALIFHELLSVGTTGIANKCRSAPTVQFD